MNMSIRYVWGRYNVKSEIETNETTYDNIDSSGCIVEGSGWLCNAYTIDEDGYYHVNDSEPNKRISASGSNQVKLYQYCISKSAQYPNPASRDPIGDILIEHHVPPIYEGEETGTYSLWQADRHNTDDQLRVYVILETSSIKTRGEISATIVSPTTVESAGSLIEYLSSGTQNLYPTNDKHDDGYWYKLRGRDAIDPTISYDNKLIFGQSATIQLTRSTSVQYGGIITYDYQVNIDGTNWVDIGSTTATSMNYTIPATATQFQARVRARDNMGFTSTTWVTGPLATVAPPYVRTRLRRKNASGTYDLIHLMTSADNVVQDDGSNVQDIINNIKQRLNLS